jgi:ankyrin repeat protein
MMQAYGTVVTAVRKNDTELVRKYYENGTVQMGVNVSNRFGESILHIACRRANIGMVRMLVTDFKLNVAEIRDDYGRTPLHDAFWVGMSKQALVVVDFLLKQPFVTDLLVCEDLRGFTPLEYTRKEDRQMWLRFLSHRKTELCPTNIIKTATSTAPITPVTSDDIAVSTSNIAKRSRSGSVIIEADNNKRQCLSTITNKY